MITFIHIPKTGGSTFTNLLRETLSPNNKSLSHFIKEIETEEIKIEILHIQFQHPERLSMCGDIFKQPDKYINHKIFTIIRHPVDRIISEYNFQKYTLRNGPKIRRLKPIPDTLEEYIENKGTWNYQLSFLLGEGLIPINKPTEEDLKNVIDCFEKLNINVGVTDKYVNFLNLFEKNTGIELNKNVSILKKSVKSTETKISEELRNKIIKYNDLDYQLYNYAKSKINNTTNKKFDLVWSGKFKY